MTAAISLVIFLASVVAALGLAVAAIWTNPGVLSGHLGGTAAILAVVALISGMTTVIAHDA